MGSDYSSTNLLRASWHNISPNIYKNKTTLEVVREAMVSYSSEVEMIQNLNKLKQRISDHHPCVVKIVYFIKNSSRLQICECSKSYSVLVYYEYLSYTLERIKKQKLEILTRKQNRRQIRKAVIRGALNLVKKYGCFAVRADQVWLEIKSIQTESSPGFEKIKKCHLWIHSLPSHNEAFKTLETQRQMCQSIIDLFRWGHLFQDGEDNNSKSAEDLKKLENHGSLSLKGLLKMEEEIQTVMMSRQKQTKTVQKQQFSEQNPQEIFSNRKSYSSYISSKRESVQNIAIVDMNVHNVHRNRINSQNQSRRSGKTQRIKNFEESKVDPINQILENKVVQESLKVGVQQHRCRQIRANSVQVQMAVKGDNLRNQSRSKPNDRGFELQAPKKQGIGGGLRVSEAAEVKPKIIFGNASNEENSYSKVRIFSSAGQNSSNMSRGGQAVRQFIANCNENKHFLQKATVMTTALTTFGAIKNSKFQSSKPRNVPTTLINESLKDTRKTIEKKSNPTDRTKVELSTKDESRNQHSVINSSKKKVVSNPISMDEMVPLEKNKKKVEHENEHEQIKEEQVGQFVYFNETQAPVVKESGSSSKSEKGFNSSITIKARGKSGTIEIKKKLSNQEEFSRDGGYFKNGKVQRDIFAKRLSTNNEHSGGIFSTKKLEASGDGGSLDSFRQSEKSLNSFKNKSLTQKMIGNSSGKEQFSERIFQQDQKLVVAQKEKIQIIPKIAESQFVGNDLQERNNYFCDRRENNEGGLINQNYFRVYGVQNDEEKKSSEDENAREKMQKVNGWRPYFKKSNQFSSSSSKCEKQIKRSDFKKSNDQLSAENRSEESISPHVENHNTNTNTDSASAIKIFNPSMKIQESVAEEESQQNASVSEKQRVQKMISKNKSLKEQFGAFLNLLSQKSNKTLSEKAEIQNPPTTNQIIRSEVQSIYHESYYESSKDRSQDNQNNNQRVSRNSGSSRDIKKEQELKKIERKAINLQKQMESLLRMTSSGHEDYSIKEKVTKKKLEFAELKNEMNTLLL